MIQKIAIGIFLLLCVFGAGCIIEGNDQTPAEIIGDWEGYDAAAKTSYDLQCSANGYAELEIDDESTFPEIELTKRGTWERNGNTYTLTIANEQYSFTIAENLRTAELKTPDGKTVTMYRDY